jgi:hypothetical protein
VHSEEGRAQQIAGSGVIAAIKKRRAAHLIYDTLGYFSIG